MKTETGSLAWELTVRLLKLTLVITLACVLAGIAAGLLGGDEGDQPVKAGISVVPE